MNAPWIFIITFVARGTHFFSQFAFDKDVYWLVFWKIHTRRSHDETNFISSMLWEAQSTKQRIGYKRLLRLGEVRMSRRSAGVPITHLHRRYHCASIKWLLPGQFRESSPGLVQTELRVVWVEGQVVGVTHNAAQLLASVPWTSQFIVSVSNLYVLAAPGAYIHHHASYVLRWKAR